MAWWSPGQSDPPFEWEPVLRVSGIVLGIVTGAITLAGHLWRLLRGQLRRRLAVAKADSVELHQLHDLRTQNRLLLQDNARLEKERDAERARGDDLARQNYVLIERYGNGGGLPSHEESEDERHDITA